MRFRRAKPDKQRKAGTGAIAGALVCAGVAAFFLLVPLFSPASRAAEDDAAAAKPKKGKYQKSRLTNDESEITSDKRRLLLTTGEDKAVDLDFEANAGAQGIAIGNPTVVATTLVKLGDKRQIVFKPLKSGETTVTIRDVDGTIRLIFQVRITGSNLLRVASEVRDLVRDIEGIDIRIVGPKVIIEGEILVPSDYGRLLAVISDKTYSDFVMNLTTLSPLAMQVLAKRIQDDINTFAPNVKTRVVNGMIFLEGTVDNGEQANRSARVATLYLPELRPGSMLEKDPSVQRLQGRSLIQNFIVINPPPAKKQEKLVRITVHFVELAKEYLRSFGFKWEPGFTVDPQIQFGQQANGAAGANGGGATFSGTISSLIPKLATAQNAGYARLIKTGTLIVRSGQPAKLVESRQVSAASIGQNGQVTQGAQEVGLSVAVTPSILGQSEDIQMDLVVDQSNLIGRTPALTSKHKIETKIYVKSNESAAVGGVTASDVGTTFNKDDPKVGNFDQGTEPLFQLLHSKKFEKSRGQFVIFVTPQIIENASEGTEDLKKNFRVKAK